MIRFNCPKCDSKLQIEDGRAGEVADCPDCGQPITIPIESTVAARASHCFRCGKTLHNRLRCRDCARVMCSQLCFDKHSCKQKARNSSLGTLVGCVLTGFLLFVCCGGFFTFVAKLSSRADSSSISPESSLKIQVKVDEPPEMNPARAFLEQLQSLRQGEAGSALIDRAKDFQRRYGVSPEAFVATFGKPDMDGSTEFDDPQPLVVTRWLTYKQEKVSAIYLLEKKDHSWQLYYFCDPYSLKPLLDDEIARRLSVRGRLRQQP